MLEKCIVIAMIIVLVFILFNESSCENYSGLDKQENSIPCYQAIRYKNLEESRDYNPDNVSYDDPNHEEGYDFSSENVPLSNSILPMPSM